MLALCFYRRQDHRKTRRPGSIILISICWTEASAGFLYDRSGCVDTVSHCSNIGALRNDECLETLRSDGFPALKGLLVGCLEQHLLYVFSFTSREGHPLRAADPRPSVGSTARNCSCGLQLPDFLNLIHVPLLLLMPSACSCLPLPTLCLWIQKSFPELNLILEGLAIKFEICN